MAINIDLPKDPTKGAQAIEINIWKVLATISIGGIHCLFLHSDNYRYMKYFILLISGSSVKGGEIAEFDAEGAWAVGADI